MVVRASSQRTVCGMRSAPADPRSPRRLASRAGVLSPRAARRDSPRRRRDSRNRTHARGRRSEPKRDARSLRRCRPERRPESSRSSRRRAPPAQAPRSSPLRPSSGRRVSTGRRVKSATASCSALRRRTSWFFGHAFHADWVRRAPAWWIDARRVDGDGRRRGGRAWRSSPPSRCGSSAPSRR